MNTYQSYILNPTESLARSALTKIGLNIAGRLALCVSRGLLLFSIVAVFAISVGEFEGRSRSCVRQFPSWGQWILIIIIETPATCCVMTWWGLGVGRGGGGWFLESLRAVCPTCLPCSQALRFPRTPEHSLGGCHSPVLQGYALHSAAVRGTQASQAPLPTLFSLDDFKLGKLPVRGFAICVARAHGIFYSLSLEVRPLQSRVVTCRGACFQTFFLLPIAIIW